MNTTGSNEAGGFPRPGVEESDHCELVKRFVKEAFSGAGAAPRQVQSLQKTLPDPGSFGDSPSAAPPVHPLTQPVRATPAESQQTPTGAHKPGSTESYAFGEPRCNGSALLSGRRSDAAPSAAKSPAAVPAAAPYYFIQQAPAGASPASPPEYANLGGPVPAFDVDRVRRDFPALHQSVNGHPLIWLDNAATTHKPQSVIDATSRFYGRDNSNIHRAAHTPAARATELFETGRERVREFLGAASAKEIIFVRGTTEAINLVAQTYGRSQIGAGDEIIVSELEHHANIVPWQMLAQQTGATLRVIPINDRGELRVDEFARLLGSKTKIVAVSHVSNSLGSVNPVEAIIALSHAHGVPVLIDGAQSTPHLPVNVTALDADFYAFSGHKIFGPTGIGALYGKAELLEKMPPWQGGGHMIKDVRFEKTVYQEAPEKFEAGTPDIAGVVGLTKAIEYLLQLGLPAVSAYEHALLEYATRGLASVPGLRPIGTAAQKASVLSFVIPGVSSEQIARHLDRQGIAVRAGHHCAMPALRHFGLETSVRPSLALYNTREEVDALVRALRSLKPN